MASSDFRQSEVEDLLARCHRRCCICHRFCGVKIELDHIEGRTAKNANSIDNAIPVCFDCHAEIHSYNPKHPRGRKFTAQELKLHRDQWIAICRENPRALYDAPREVYVGPLQGMLDELAYNRTVVEMANQSLTGNSDAFYRPAAPLKNDQFLRAIGEGSIAILKDDLKQALMSAYSMLGRAKMLAESNAFESAKDAGFGATSSQLRAALKDLASPLDGAYGSLLSFLGDDSAEVLAT